MKLTKLSSNSSLISLEFYESVPDGANFTVVIVRRPFYSIKFSKLKNYEFTLKLNKFTFINTEVKAITENIKSSAQIGISTCIGISMISDPSAVWSLLNSIQLIKYLPLSEEKLPSGIEKFCLGIGDFGLIPNLMEYIFVTDSASEPEERPRAVGISSSVFMLNAGPIIFYLIAGVVAWPFVFIISKLRIGKIALKFGKILDNYRYSFFLRFWIQSFLDIGLFALICLVSVITN